MSVDNTVSVNLTPEQQANILSLVDQLVQELGWTVTLSVTDRQRLTKAATGTETFLNQALDLARQSPDVLPRSFSVEEFEKDVATRTFLLSVRSRLLALGQRVDDTIASCGSEAFQAGLTVYKTFKTYGQDTGMDAQVQELAKRFKKNGKASASEGSTADA